MVQQAVERGVPFRWVTADSVYGDSPTFVVIGIKKGSAFGA